MEDGRNESVMSWKPRRRKHSPRNSQEERSSVSGRFQEELHIEKSLETWSGFGQMKGMKWALRARSLVKRMWLIGWLQWEAREVFYKVAGARVCWRFVPDEREGEDTPKIFGWCQQFLVFVGRMDTQAALGCSVSLCCSSHICWRECGTP